MTLRTKTLLTVSLILAALVVVLYFYSQNRLVEDYETLERQLVERNVQRAVNLIEDETSVVENSVIDYAVWDDTYQFIQDGDLSYVRRHLSDDTFISQRVNLMIFLDNDRKVVYSKALDITQVNAVIGTDRAVVTALAENPQLNHFDSPSGSQTGLIILPQGAMLVASAPILPSERNAPILGTLIWARYLNQTEIDRLGDVVQIDLEIYPEDGMPDSSAFVAGELDHDTPIFTRPLNDETIAGYGLLETFNEPDHLVLRFEQPRAIYQQGVDSISTFLIFLGVSSVIVLGAMLLLLEKMVLSRVATLSKDVNQIGQGRLISSRIIVEGEDELGKLGDNINQMLERLENSQSALRESEAKLRTVVNSAPIILFAVDENGIFTLFDGRGVTDLGLQSGSLVGLSIFESYRDQPAIIESVKLALQGQPIKAVLNFGDQFWEAWYTPMNNHGSVGGVIGVSTNITDRIRAEEELRRARDAAEAANRSKSTFLANMSHELRTPMNAIIGYSDLVMSGLYGAVTEQQKDRLTRVVDNGKHLLSLINDVLDLSKIESGKMELHLEQFNLPDLIQTTVSSVQPMVEGNRNRLQVFMSEDIDSMYADPTRVRQVLFNLLSNAAKFTSEGDIWLRVARDNDTLRFEVEDSGIGIPPEKLSTIFDEFVQADSSTTRKFGGTGLGLAISRRFCVMMGGSLRVESEVQKGSIFTMILPVTVTEKYEYRSQAVPTKKRTTGSIKPVRVSNRGRVLLVDDDDTVHELLAHYLKDEGLEVLTARTGKEGLDVARREKPDVIVLDVLLPEMDGWVVLALLKNDPALHHIPVIMLSIVEDKSTGFALGAADYLTKPIDPDSLRRVVQRHYQETTQVLPALVVEDDPSTRQLMRDLLESEGRRVLEAENGRVALEHMQTERPALILLDLMMPEMDGFEFLDELYQHDDWRSIPVIVVTAMELSDAEREHLSGKVERIIQKGAYNREDLLSELRQRILKHV